MSEVRDVTRWEYPGKVVLPLGSVWRVVAATLLAIFLWATPTFAQEGARDLRVAQPQSWYGTHVGILGGLGLASVGLLMPWGENVQPRIVAAPAFERGVANHFSNFSANVSDVTLLTSVAAPVVTMGAVSQGHSWGNSLIIYGEANFAALVANILVKNVVRRARPYTHGTTLEARAEVRRKGDDAYLSFYSGHASLSFTAATAGSYLLSAVAEDEALRATHWGVSLALSSFTAHARVRAGRHYPTDVLVGAAAGIGFGLGVPALQRVQLRTSPAQAVAAICGTAVGASLALLLPDKVVRPIAELNPQFEPALGGAKLSFNGKF